MPRLHMIKEVFSTNVSIDMANAGRRTDSYVRRWLPHVPLSVLMKWIRLGKLRVNGKRVKPSTRLAMHDVIVSPATHVPVQPSMHMAHHILPPLDICYHDADILVINKPAGLCCHAGTNHQTDSVMARVYALLGIDDLTAVPIGHRPGLAQRLDKEASGLLVVGLHAAALRHLSSANQARKTYTALVDGCIKDDHGVIDIPLRVDDEPMGNKPRTHADPTGKPAYTSFTVLQRFARATRVAVDIRTGRTHQIRAHMRYIGHPICGDPRYAPAARNLLFRQTYGLQRLCLHAEKMQLTHPMHQEMLQFDTPMPNDLQRMINNLGKYIKIVH